MTQSRPYRSKRRPKPKLSMNEHIAAWVKSSTLKGWVYIYNVAEVIAENQEKIAKAGGDPSVIPYDLTEEELSDDWDPDDSSVFVRLMGKRGHQASFNFSSMTFEELIATKAFFDLAFNRAVVAVRARDRKARDDADKGKYTNTRLYRQLPEFVVRTRLQRGYGKGIPVGPLDVLEGKFLPEHFSEGDAEQGSNLAEPEPQPPVASDNGTPTDFTEGILEMGSWLPETVSGGVPSPNGSTAPASPTAGRDD